MDTEAELGAEEDELAISLTPAQFGVGLAVLVAVLVLIPARRAR